MLGTIPNAKLVRQWQPGIHIIPFQFASARVAQQDAATRHRYALDREAICKRVGVKLDNDNRLLSGPLPYGSLGYDTKVPGWTYQPILAKALIFAVKREFKSITPLIFAHQGNEATRLACQEIVRQLREAGLDVSLVEIDDRFPDPREADLRFEMTTVTEPFYDLVTMLTRDNPTLFQFADPRLRQTLIELMQVPRRDRGEHAVAATAPGAARKLAVLPALAMVRLVSGCDSVSGLLEKPSRSSEHRRLEGDAASARRMDDAHLAAHPPHPTGHVRQERRRDLDSAVAPRTITSQSAQKRDTA